MMFSNKVRTPPRALVPATLVWITACCCHLLVAPLLTAQVMDDSIVAKHVRVRIPAERQWLGRDTISDLERCWEFVQASTGGYLPSRVLVVIHWQDSIATTDPDRSTISIGLNDSAAAADMKGYLLHNAACELARFALINLSDGAAARPEKARSNCRTATWCMVLRTRKAIRGLKSDSRARLPCCIAVCATVSARQKGSHTIPPSGT